MANAGIFPRIRITLGPRPGKKSIKRLQELNISHCVTLLSEREGAPLIEKICNQLGTGDTPCAWVWLPLEGGKLEILAQTDIQSLVTSLSEAVNDHVDAHIYLHCSAGIHRTGFFAYILLRLMGHDCTTALVELAALRPVTSAQVGEDRIALAEEIVTGFNEALPTA